MTKNPKDRSRTLDVQKRQEPIAAWMQHVMALKGLKPTTWAAAAGLGRDTVSRAIKPGYLHVSSTRTLIQLAQAAGVPAPLDLGNAPPGVPSSAVLAEIIDELLKRLVPDREFDPAVTSALGKALRHTLLELAEDSERQDDPEHARMAARISSRQMLPGDNDPPGQETK